MVTLDETMRRLAADRDEERCSADAAVDLGELAAAA
ncbi:hypothetical protein IW248_001797 [Micromonospora ureilytica]|uniref:Uncharacterized protein n=1 Tax=Micromonospora ureilytica TaxID=709868 RepID=A0ABS0JEL6_9ACTN|nr:hypothetical protein [Micromonospora ureilytica]